MDYWTLFDRLNRPPARVFRHQRPWLIAHEPPPPPFQRFTDVQSLMRRVPPANRRKLADLALAMLAQGAQDRLPQLTDPGRTVNFRLLAELVERCGWTFRYASNLPYNTGEAPSPPGPLFPPKRLARALNDRAPYWGDEYYDRRHYFLDSWFRLVRYYVPMVLPHAPPTLEKFLRRMPEERRDRWRNAIASHFEKSTGAYSWRSPSVREVSLVPLTVWRSNCELSTDDLNELADHLRYYGFVSPEDDRARRQMLRAEHVDVVGVRNKA